MRRLTRSLLISKPPYETGDAWSRSTRLAARCVSSQPLPHMLKWTRDISALAKFYSYYTRKTSLWASTNMACVVCRRAIQIERYCSLIGEGIRCWPSVKLIQGMYDKMTRKRGPSTARDPLDALPVEITEMILGYLSFKSIVYVYPEIYTPSWPQTQNMLPRLTELALIDMFIA